MEQVSPTPDDDAPRAAAHCPACRAATAGDQRYCLACGALLGDRRLDPIEMLTPDAGVDPVGGPPSGPTAAAPRAVPLAAATAAIVVAGISGMLVTQGGSGTGARAAVIAAPPVPAPAGSPADAAPPSPADDSDPLPGDDPLPADPLPADEPLPAESEAPADEPADDAAADGDASEDDESADEPAAEPTPRVWLLALEGPQAAEAVERVAKRGVRLSGMQSVAATTQPNATALVGGTKPADAEGTGNAGAADPAATAPGTGNAGSATPTAGGGTSDAGTGTAPSLPAALTAAKRTWRAYVDVQPTSGAVLPGACAAAPAGDAAATLLASRLPFAAIEGIDCDKAVTSLEALGNDLSAGEDIPAFSYVAMGGCAAPDRPPIALPDAVEDTVTTITESTEYQQDGMLVVTTVGTQDACTPGAAAPGAPSDPANAPALGGNGPAPATNLPAGAPSGDATAGGDVAPTVVLRPAATAGRTVKAKLDLLALSRSMADVLGVTPPGAAGDDTVPAIALPGVAKK